MDVLSELHAQVRAPRVHLADFTPAVLRFQDDQRASGTLQVLSVTGGLLSLPGPIDQGSRVKLMFLTHTGAVQGAAVESSLNLALRNQDAAEQNWMEKRRAASSHGNQPRGRLFTAAAGAAALGVSGLGCALLSPSRTALN